MNYKIISYKTFSTKMSINERGGRKVVSGFGEYLLQCNFLFLAKLVKSICTFFMNSDIEVLVLFNV